MKRYSKNLKFYLIFLLVCFLPLQLTQAGTSAGTIYSYESPEPIIDGYLEPAHWDLTRALNITLYNLDNQGDTMVVTMLSIFDEADGTISFGFIFPDTTENEDIFGIAFKNNVTGDFILDTPEWGFNGYNDLKGFNFDDDEVVDAITGHQKIQAYLDTYSNATSIEYTQIHSTDYDFCNLHVGIPRNFAFDTFALIVSLVSSMLLLVIIERKRQLRLKKSS